MILQAEQSNKHSGCGKTGTDVQVTMAVRGVRVPIRRATQKSDSSRFRVSGFGFRRLKPTFTVCFGFRVSIGPGEVKSSESVSGFGFRVSIGPGEVKSSESVSGFGFRSVLGKLSLQSRFRVSGFGFRSVLGKLSLQSRFRVSGFDRSWGS